MDFDKKKSLATEDSQIEEIPVDEGNLAIPDSQIEEISIDKRNLEIDLTKTRLDEGQKEELRMLFNSFKELFSEKQGLPHVLCHEIGTGDTPPVVSRPYRYDIVKQSIIDYHVEKMLKEDPLPVKVITDHVALTRLRHGKNLSSRMIRWILKLAEFNVDWEHHPGTQKAVADVLSRNPVERIIEEKVNCAIIRDLVLSLREQLIEEQKTDPELGRIYRYLENPENSSVNATICENWSRDFKLVEDLLSYVKYASTLGELRVYIP
ncbi:retrovirus-related Pol polyprotein from transposon 297 [Trichonephila clavipes]|nr:retrovirus-related Pol polyprotein from transposon 297 [Trichonephila clavipes]